MLLISKYAIRHSSQPVLYSRNTVWRLFKRGNSEGYLREWLSVSQSMLQVPHNAGAFTYPSLLSQPIPTRKRSHGFFDPISAYGAAMVRDIRTVNLTSTGFFSTKK